MSIFTSRRTIVTLLKHAAQALNDILENDDAELSKKAVAPAGTPNSAPRNQEAANDEQ